MLKGCMHDYMIFFLNVCHNLPINFQDKIKFYIQHDGSLHVFYKAIDKPQ